MPTVSIITPVYNAARWLPQTLASVHAQTFADWENILVDDGSTDDSVALIQAAAAADPRIRLLRMPCNGGPSAARNMALDAARGRFVAFLDADDLWLPEKLDRALQWMTQHDHAFIYHDYRHISHDGVRIGKRVNGPDELNLRTLHTRRGVGSCLTVVIDQARIPGFRFPNVSPHHAEDFCLWLDLIRGGHTGHRFPADLGRYRLSPRSRSANKLEGAANAWHIYRHFSGLSLARAAFWWIQYAFNAAWLHLQARPR